MNKRQLDKTFMLFYFGDIEANRISISNPTAINVPSALERQGDFSDDLGWGSNGCGIVDFSRRFLPSGLWSKFD